MSEDVDFIDTLCEQLYDRGYCILPNSLPDALAMGLFKHISSLDTVRLKAAGVGRNDDYQQQQSIRRDKILWIDADSPIEQQWLNWLESIKQGINRRLYLGLASIESHFAIYQPGDFYKKHLDAFHGQSNRKLSVVTYLNPQWSSTYGGELVLYSAAKPSLSWQETEELVRVLPAMATTVIFLSEEFPHEVLPGAQCRYSIASWFRLQP